MEACTVLLCCVQIAAIDKRSDFLKLLYVIFIEEYDTQFLGIKFNLV